MTLDVLIKRLDEIASGSQLEEIKQKIGAAGLRRIARGFAEETDPYGQRWQPVATHKGHQKILHDSGDLQSGWKFTVTSGGVRFYNNIVYAARQNYRRSMVPNSIQGLPPTWVQMCNRAFANSIRAKLKGEQSPSGDE